MGIGAAIHKIRRKVEDYGFGATARKSAAWLAGFVVAIRTYRIYRISVDEMPATESAPGPFTLHWVREGDAGCIAQIEETAEWIRGELASKLGRSSICLAALDGKTVAGFNLITFREVAIPLLELRRTLRASRAWSEHIAVAKPYRRRGLASRIRMAVFAELRRRGIRWLYGGTLVSNAASLALARKVGFRNVADVRLCKVLGFRGWRYQRVRE